MASSSSFDIVSRYDRQEVVNALDQARREITTRYDLKSSKTELNFEGEELSIVTDDEYRLGVVRDLIESKFVRRGVPLKTLRYSEPTPASGGAVRQSVKLVEGIEQELGKKIAKAIRDEYPKVQAQIQGDAVRVTAKSKDDLQGVIGLLKDKDYPVELQYVNYR